MHGNELRKAGRNVEAVRTLRAAVDIAPDGRLLMMRWTTAWLMFGKAPGQPDDRDLTAYDRCEPADLSVQALAARAGLSPRQFARAFTEDTGVTPGRYVGDIRLETARRLFEESEHTVAQVARRAGYGSTESLRRTFQQTLGVSPVEYRTRFTTDRSRT